MDLSAKMPAQQDATLPAKMPATRPSDAPAYAGEGGSDDAPVSGCSQTTNPGVKWDSVNDNRANPAKQGSWQTQDAKTGPSDGWSTGDRKDENDEGALPQRDPDNDGDLN